MNKESVILDAAKRCYLRLGVTKTAVADVARESGISRATIYRRFASAEDLFLAVLARESQHMADDCKLHLANFTDPVERIVEGMLFSLDEIPGRPLHAHFFQSEAKTWINNQAIASPALHKMCVDILQNLIGLRSVTERVDAQPVEQLAELILRLLFSYAQVPSPLAGNRDEMRDMLYAILAPVVGTLLKIPAAKTARAAAK